MARSITQERELSQTASRQDVTWEYQTLDKRETVLLKNKGTEFDKTVSIANTLMARDYKGFGNQGMNGVIEIERR